MNHLGSWAIIDIETTGLVAGHDQIIDIGFLRFTGTTLREKYSSLVRYTHGLPQFIQKLTGITDKMVSQAPEEADVLASLDQLQGHRLIAHNSSFEQSFLGPHLPGVDNEDFVDSLLYLSLLFPEKSTLNLEQFILEWNLSSGETHRGLEDSLDLLKVLIMATYTIKENPDRESLLNRLFKQHHLTDHWFYHFFSLDTEDFLGIGRQIGFDPREYRAKEENPQAHRTPGQRVSSLEFSGKNIRTIYETKARESSSFEKREPQIDLSLRTGQAFKNNVHALIQAPTGTGKTLGHLIPASLFVLQGEGQVLVATGTRALQTQVMEREIPRVREFLGLSDEDFRVVALVGQGNHLCELLFRKTHREDLLSPTAPFGERFTRMYFDLVFTHNDQAPYGKKMLRGHLPFVLKKLLKDFGKMDREVAMDFRSCLGHQCPHREGCSYVTGIREARRAHLIVGNHALMFSWPKSLPRPGHIVVDEAHRIEQEATGAFSLEVSGKTMDALVKNLGEHITLGPLYHFLSKESTNGNTQTAESLREEIGKIRKSMENHLPHLPSLMEHYFKEKTPKYNDYYWNELPMIEKKHCGDPTTAAVMNHLEAVRIIFSECRNLLLPHLTGPSAEVEENREILAPAVTFLARLEDAQEALGACLDGREGYARSLRYSEREGYLLHCAPVDIGRTLHDNLLEVSESVVFTSATLGNAKGEYGVKGIEWVSGYNYLDGKKRFKGGFFLPPIYDYKTRACVYLCDDTPTLSSPVFVPETLSRIIPLVRKMGGRGLMIFSSVRRFEAAREYLFKELGNEVPLFVQGMGARVVEAFRESGHGLLVGMESFGEGIDIPGEALQFIFIDKIPDLRRSLVVQKRQDLYEEKIGNAFEDYYLSYRARALQQKLGRLLRTKQDYGGIIVADCRVARWKNHTMEKFLRLMEPYNIHRSSLAQACRGVEEFLHRPPLGKEEPTRPLGRSC